jgi:membrane-associated phospholipid phosphatase
LVLLVVLNSVRRRAAPTATHPFREHGELLAGVLLLLWSFVAALAVWKYPGPNELDRWGFRVQPPALHEPLFLGISHLGSTVVLVGGSALAAVVVVGRDRWRAVSCLVGPIVASAVVEWVVKPMVGRRYVDVLTFPSGSVTVVASLATAWALAVPRKLVPVVVVAGATVVVLMGFAVVGLRWHYPSDALVGATFGAGFVLTLDAVLQQCRLLGARAGSR